MQVAGKEVMSVDVGFGNVKYTLEGSMHSSVRCGIFPSNATPELSDSGGSLDSQKCEQLNTMTVEVDGVAYMVGKDAGLGLDDSSSHVLDSSFPRTKEYLALLRGALACMATPAIDLLVLGLPVSTLSRHKNYLEQTVVGKHRVPIADDPSRHMDVWINQVHVIAQPLGGFLDHAVRSGIFSSLQSSGETCLTIDVGFFTVDWVISVGPKVVNRRSGSTNGGMSRILREIAKIVGREQDVSITNLRDVDAALANGNRLKLFGDDVDISEAVALGKSKGRDAIINLSGQIGEGHEIGKIIILGGGAHFFKEIVQERYPRHQIKIAEDSIFANVRGFQLAGEERVYRGLVNQARNSKGIA